MRFTRPVAAITAYLGRHCDLEKAARRYKYSYGAAVTIWFAWWLILIAGAADVYADYKAVASPDMPFLGTLHAHPAIVIKVLIYQVAWVLLAFARWGAFAYGSLGLAHAKLQAKANTTL